MAIISIQAQDQANLAAHRIDGPIDHQRRVVLATTNEGKAREIRAILADLDLEVVTLADLGCVMPLVIETDRSYAENAVNKATVVARLTGLTALADDSGIEVDALDGGPGPLSARFGGIHARSDRDRYELLLKRMRDVPAGSRGAHFRAVVALAIPGNHPVVREGSVEGRIATEPRGSNGHGYDPVFEVRHGAEWKTAAELSADEKNSISHRGRALAELRTTLQRLRLHED